MLSPTLLRKPVSIKHGGVLLPAGRWRLFSTWRRLSPSGDLNRGPRRVLCWIGRCLYPLRHCVGSF